MNVGFEVRGAHPVENPAATLLAGPDDLVRSREQRGLGTRALS